MSIGLIRGFEVDLDLSYDFGNHMWVRVVSGDLVRIGMDSLGLETAGTLAQLEFAKVGTTLSRGATMGSLEAEKFVGPLVTPLSGAVVAVNDEAMARPSTVEGDPYREGWMIEMAPSALSDELPMLASGHDVVTEFERKVEQYRRDGVLAE